MGLCTQLTVFLHCTYSEMQATNGDNTVQAQHNQAHNNKPNTMSLRHNQAYGTQPEKASPDSNTDREYEVIPPLVHEETRLNNTEVNDYRETSNVQTSQSTTQPHQQTSKGQPNEEVEQEHSHMQPEQQLTESGEHKNSTGNENVYHSNEPKAEDEEDKAAPYEVPIHAVMKSKNESL